MSNKSINTLNLNKVVCIYRQRRLIKYFVQYRYHVLNSLQIDMRLRVISLNNYLKSIKFCLYISSFNLSEFGNINFSLTLNYNTLNMNLNN